MYIATIDPEDRTLTLKEERRDPFEGEEVREVLINTHSLDGRTLETDLRTRSITFDEDGNVRLELENTGDGSRENQNGGFWDEVESELGIEYSEGEVYLNGDKSVINNYRDFLRYLHQRGDITEEDLPVSRSNARSRYLLNNEPTHLSGEMSRPEQIADGIFFEANVGSDGIKRNIRALAQQLAIE